MLTRTKSNYKYIQKLSRNLLWRCGGGSQRYRPLGTVHLQIEKGSSLYITIGHYAIFITMLAQTERNTTMLALQD